MIDRSEIRELRDVLEEARVYLNTTMPGNKHTGELLATALKMADRLIARPTSADAGRARKAAR